MSIQVLLKVNRAKVSHKNMSRFFALTKTLALNSLLCTALLFSVASYADEKTDMAQLQKEIEALQKELKKVQGTRSTLQKDLQKSETDIGELQKKADAIKQELQKENQELKQLKDERSSLEQQRRLQQTHMSQQIVAAYKLGEQSEAKVCEQIVACIPDATWPSCSWPWWKPPSSLPLQTAERL